MSKEFNWSNPAPAPKRAAQRPQQRGAPKQRAAPQQRGYSPRQPTSSEFSRNFKVISDIPLQDKYNCLELCDQKYTKQCLLQYAHDETLVDALMPGT